jgi:hypothetical protein
MGAGRSQPAHGRVQHRDRQAERPAPGGDKWGETAGRQPGVSLEVATDNQGTGHEPQNFRLAVAVCPDVSRIDRDRPARLSLD